MFQILLVTSAFMDAAELLDARFVCEDEDAIISMKMSLGPSGYP